MVNIENLKQVTCDIYTNTNSGHWRKYLILDQFLKSEASNYIQEDDFVFFSDGLDVTFNGNVQHIKDIYYEYLKDEQFDTENTHWPLLFNSEKNKWPPISLFNGIKVRFCSRFR